MCWSLAGKGGTHPAQLRRQRELLGRVSGSPQAEDGVCACGGLAGMVEFKGKGGCLCGRRCRVGSSIDRRVLVCTGGG